MTFRDQDLELEAFNRSFEVRADDRRFASVLLDARMTELLVQRAVGSVIETVGNRILVARPAATRPTLTRCSASRSRSGSASPMW